MEHRGADIQFLREHASSNALEIALCQLGVANSSNPHVRHFSKRALTDHLNDERETVRFAKKQKIAMRLGMTDSEDQGFYQQVLAAVNTRNFDQVYLTTLKTIHEMFAAQNEDQLATTRNFNFTRFANQDLVVQNRQLAADKVYLGL